MLDRQKWMRRFIESAVIIGSILLAFSIDAWWQDRQQESMERQITLAVISELEANTEMAKDVIDSHKTAIASIKAFLHAEAQQFANRSSKEIFESIAYFPYSMEFVANLSAANMLMQSPPRNKSGIQMRRSVGEYMRMAREQAGITIDEERRKILRQMSDLIAERKDFDFERADYIYTPSLIAQLGPETLSQLRSDSAVIKSLIDKSHIQIVLLGRVEQLIGNMEKLRAELSALADSE